MLKLLLYNIFIFFILNTIQAQRYNFKNYSVANGLTQSEIFAICEDKRGILWMGSAGGGIIKFDGYTFTSYREEDGLLNGFVHSIFEDDKGIIWIGTEEGVNKYDGFSFSKINDATNLGKSFIRTIIQDKSNNLWFGTENNGLFIYNDSVVTHFSTNEGLPHNKIYCLYEAKDSSIWVGTEKGVCKFQKQHLTCYSKRDGLSSNIIRGICDDLDGKLWFATYGGGVNCLTDTGFIHYTVEKGLSHNKVFTAFNDGKGNLWFGTAKGISKYNGTSFKNYYESNGLSSDIILCINKDSFGDIWFGTSGGGISRLDNERFIHFMENEKMGRQVYAIVQAPNGNMLMGTSKGGVTVFDGNDYSLLRGIRGFTDSRVRVLFYSPDSTLWIGTLGDGVYKFDNNGFKHYSYLNGLASNNITGFTSDSTGNIWISTMDSGICIFHRDSNMFQTYTENNGLGSNNIYSIIADRLGNTWIGTENGILNKLTVSKIDSSLLIKTYTKKDGLPGKVIRSIVIDTTNTIYLGTAGGGIVIYDGTTFKTFIKKDGLCSNNIYLLLVDHNNNLWAGTEQGIDRITFNTDFSIKKCQHYGKDEGFTGIEVYRNSCCMDANGNIWFGTINGATRYDPREDIPVTTQPKIHITKIKLFFNNIETSGFPDSITAWFPIPVDLSLPYNKNNLTFEFSSIYLCNPNSVKYKWILEGFTGEWSPALFQREITYSNLPPGEYTFKVLSCGENNICNEEPAVFQFNILPPFWQEWWFKFPVIAILVIILWLVFYLRIKRIKRNNRTEKEKLEMEKNIIELEQEAARLQMNPHFIFNSLNSIQGFIALNDTFQAKRYLAKFARLMRLILENAREEYIPLKNEVDILENYLELEKLSTNNKFEFSINAYEIDTETLEIPPMMIQPFVENAIVHGIKKKEGKGLIEISFTANSGLLICEIIDNGIGREKSSENKPVIKVKHKSTGISVTRKRLEQLKNQTGLNAGIEIIDLKEKNGIPAGTKVILSIPFETY